MEAQNTTNPFESLAQDFQSLAPSLEAWLKGLSHPKAELVRGALGDALAASEGNDGAEFLTQLGALNGAMAHLRRTSKLLRFQEALQVMRKEHLEVVTLEAHQVLPGQVVYLDWYLPVVNIKGVRSLQDYRTHIDYEGATDPFITLPNKTVKAFCPKN